MNNTCVRNTDENIMESTCEINPYNGATEWFNSERLFHREDGPAIIEANGNKFWYINGEFHREDGPARIFKNGREEWWLNGKLHREDGPAKIDYQDNEYWYLNGEPHREDGPAFIGYDNTKLWIQNGLLHRIDGPAVETHWGKMLCIKDIVIYRDGQIEWWLNGQKHRIDGPAVEYPNGEKQYWINDIQQFNLPQPSIKEIILEPIIRKRLIDLD